MPQASRSVPAATPSPLLSTSCPERSELEAMLMPDSPWTLDWMISVDDHVLEPPDLWQSRVEPALRDRAPKLVVDDDGEAWVFDGTRYPTYGLSAVAGRS